jgi:hypothetical protein
MKQLIFVGIVLTLLAAPLFANPGLQRVLDDITLAPVPGSSSVNVATGKITDGQDAYWSLEASGGSVATIITSMGARTTTFGVFDKANPLLSVQLFSGADVAGGQSLLSIKADGSVYVNLVDTGVNFTGNAFGYYLNVSNLGVNIVPDIVPVTKFYSDTTLNADAADHMFAVQGLGKDKVQIDGLMPGLWGTGEYVLGWEDIYGGGDLDYDDFVVMIESVQPIPEPATIVLLGLGLSFLLGKKRR